jgi:putative Mg2+ transporter-C (MgtC) family protein
VPEGLAALDWYDVVGRLAAAAFLGGLMGLERETDGHEAGLRTHLLLALGAAVFGVVSVGAFSDLVVERAEANVHMDLTRIASYVPAGVGFIGGGVILKHVGMVKGITTATSLWCAAAVGLAAGLGFFVAAIAATLLGLFALAGLKPLSRRAGQSARRRSAALVVQLHPGVGLRDTLGLVDELARNNVKQLVVGSGEREGAQEVRVEFWDNPRGDVLAGLLDRLSRLDGVRTVYHDTRG